jgi:lipoprotein NlpD
MKPVLAMLIAATLVASCASGRPPADPERGPGWYTVKRSDTLYSIAWRYGLDYHELAKWNGIDVSTPIYPGQRLRLLKPHDQSTPAISAGASVATTSDDKTPSADSGESRSTAATVTASDPAMRKDPARWIWPTAGKPLNSFVATRLDRRGIDIAGKQGQAVVAVADGKVVYSGNGLAGYGNLIIIKHSETYLSAYAYCQQRMVEEGTSVKAGRQVATMGEKDKVAKLYFEIRRNGKPVDPLKYLPKK